MNLLPSEEQLIIAATANEFLANELPLARVRELADAQGERAMDEGSWTRCAELGWLSLSLPEAAGGAGFGLPDEVMLFRELGRHLTPGPFLSSSLGARLAHLAGEAELVSAIASGRRRVGIEVGDFGVDVHPGDLVLSLGGSKAELIEPNQVEPIKGIDPGARFARFTKGAVIARAQDSGLTDRARVLAAAELLGVIEAVRDMSAAYAQTRTQFGKPIGVFQAVKHRCADMAIAAVAATGELFQAALLVEAGAADGSFHAANAYYLALSGARISAADNIQNHGAMGFTWEQDAHLHLKRALLLEYLLGDTRRTYDAILAHPKHEFV